MNGPTSYERSRLPPPHLQLVDFRADKIPTPVDERGLVVVENLINAVKDTVDPAWDWRESQLGGNAHHYYWPQEEYKSTPVSDNNTIHTFRELAVHKGFMPVGFHTWLHLITEPPEIPHREVMEYRIEAFRVAKSLFLAALKIEETLERARNRVLDIAKNPERIANNPTGIDEEGARWIDHKLHSNFAGYERHLRRVESIPQEFRIVDVGETSDPKAVIASQIGLLVRSRAFDLVPDILTA